MNKKSIIVGMSGGVDSSVAAFILKKEGFNVSGVFMKNWEEDDDLNGNCNATKDLIDAQKVCDLLQIKLHKVNFAAEYWEKVFKIFLHEYSLGNTPNPDILCNKEIKFKLFLDYAKHLKADFIATGHYARIYNNTTIKLLTAVDENKDQSYFLHGLTKEQLANCMFPIGGLLKSEVRAIAKDVGLNNYDKKDSTGICFIGERKFNTFLRKYLPAQPGKIITTNGIEVGTHQGLMYYTIGQRKGLKVGGLKAEESITEPWYVVNKDLINNILIIARGKNHPKLLGKQLLAHSSHWINYVNKDLQHFDCSAKIRYRQKSQPCSVRLLENNRLLVNFKEQQRAITPGQYIVFYENECCLGGAIIEKSI